MRLCTYTVEPACRTPEQNAAPRGIRPRAGFQGPFSSRATCNAERTPSLVEPLEAAAALATLAVELVEGRQVPRDPASIRLALAALAALAAAPGRARRGRAVSTERAHLLETYARVRHLVMGPLRLGVWG